MIERLIALGVRRFIGGPARSWVFTGLAIFGYRLLRSQTGKRQVIDIGSVGKGQKIVIEHVGETHAKQLKNERRAKKAAKVERRAAKREAKVVRKQRRSERRARVAARLNRNRAEAGA